MKKILFILIFINLLSYITVFANTSNVEKPIQNENISETMQTNKNSPIVNSKNIIVIDRKTLTPIYEKNAYEKVAMASTTKILTCIIALENSSKSEIVTISKQAANVSGSTLGLVKDMKISMNDLLYGLMLRSGNDCAVAIAEHISGSIDEFSKLMNTKAFELGLCNSNFVTPHGLDNENHYTTAYDLALLTDYALKNSDFKKIVSTKKQIISFNGYPKEISNTNELLGNFDGIYGVKTGFTFEAGRCLVSACSRNNFDIISVVLGADTKSIRTKDSKNIINYVYDNYKYVNVSSLIDNAFSNYIPIFNNIYHLTKTTSIPTLRLENLDNYNFPLFQGNIENLHTKIYSLTNFNAKIYPGNIVGKISLYSNETLLCSANILLENKIIPNTWLFYFKKLLSIYK